MESSLYKRTLRSSNKNATKSEPITPSNSTKMNDLRSRKDVNYAELDSSSQDSNISFQESNVSPHNMDVSSQETDTSSDYEKEVNSDDEEETKNKRVKKEKLENFPSHERNSPQEISELEMIRRRNVAERMKLLQELELEMQPAEPKKIHFQSAESSQKKKSFNRVKVEMPQLPLKRSQRLLNRSLGSSFNESANATESQNSFIENNDYVIPDRITDEIMEFDRSDEEGKLRFKESLADLEANDTCELNCCDFASGDLENYCKIVSKCKMWNEPLRIIDGRIYALAFHSSEKHLLLCCGDKYGNICLFNLKDGCKIDVKAHTCPVNCVTFGKADKSKFFSTSHDGTLRRGDINTTSLELIYATSDESYRNSQNSHITWHEEFESTLLVAHGSGDVRVIDVRSDNANPLFFQCHKRSVRTVQRHPLAPHYFLTSSGVGECRIFDIRAKRSKENFAEAIIDLPHKKSLSSAFFSASGRYVLSTSADDTLKVYETSEIASEKYALLKSIPHNNHTGRWLSVFKANWQPGRDDSFLVGSMQIPKRMQIYTFDGRVIHDLKSNLMETYCPVICAHPTYPIFVGGNASGRIHVYSIKSDFSAMSFLE